MRGSYDREAPLRREQIDAACRLHDELAIWKATDNALKALAQKFPGFRDEAVLLNVVAINSLYYTNVCAFVRMAQHVESVLADVKPGSFGLELVDRIAKLPTTTSQQRTRDGGRLRPGRRRHRLAVGSNGCGIGVLALESEPVDPRL